MWNGIVQLYVVLGEMLRYEVLNWTVTWFKPTDFIGSLSQLKYSLKALITMIQFLWESLPDCFQSSMGQ